MNFCIRIYDWMEFLNEISCIPFYLLAGAALLCSALMIFNDNLVRAGFTLIGAFVAIAGLYFMLNANFVAVSQILIYAVGIVLVIVFAVMLCSLKETAADTTNDEKVKIKGLRRRKAISALLCSGLFGLLVYIIKSQDWNTVSKLAGAESYQNIVPELSKQYTAQIGFQMLGNYVLSFELVSVLLLVVLVGVIILSKKQINHDRT